jgi:tetratricopeptide (TPR) repeat protein
VSSTARDEVRAGSSASGGEAASLVESAMLLRWRAPELALLLADRAVTAAQDDQVAVRRADHLAVFALNRLGRHGEAAHRLFPTIGEVNTPVGLRHELYVELAHCAAALGEPATALEAVRAVLAAGDDIAPVLRGAALVAAAEASAALGWGDRVTSALDEADELYREDASLDRDTALLLRATARAADAARHRRDGAIAEAEAQARAGRELLTGLADPEHDSGEVSARLMLEVVTALLDRDEGDAAIEEARPLLRRPVRAAAAGAVGRLRLALATRVHLAQGRHEPALTLLADAVEGAQRHGVDAVLAECLEGLSRVHEARGEFADALHCVRAARAAEGRHRRSVEAGRCTLLQNWGSARREAESLVDQVAALLTNIGTGSSGPDPDNGLVNAEIVVGGVPHRASEVPAAEVPAAEVPAAEVPAAEVPAAESEVPAAELEVPASEVPAADTPLLMHPAPGISRVEASVPLSKPANSAAVDPVVEHAETGSREPTDVLPTESPTGLDTWQPGARHRRGAGALVCVSDLLPASALSAGRSGRRRAEEPIEEPSDETPAAEVPRIGDASLEEGNAARRQVMDRPDVPPVSAVTYPLVVQPPSGSSVTREREDTGAVPSEDAEDSPQTRRESLVSGPPTAPTPRVLEWAPGGAGPDGVGESRQMGLGDLLAEALAAYQESRDVHAHDRVPSTSCDEDGGTAADAGRSRGVPRYRGLGTRWGSGLQLAPPIDRAHGDPSEALTNPLLRLPDHTAEPLWTPPETGRQSAAGD